jgi:hypothetical protein
MMVWTAQQMVASYGNAMPDSYYDGLRVEREQFEDMVRFTGEHWAAMLGRWVEFDVIDYLSCDSYRVEVRVAGFGAVSFTSLDEAEGWVDRMFPPAEGAPHE